MKATRLMSLGLALLLILGMLVAPTAAQDEGKVITTGIQMVGGDIPTLDPSLAETSSSIEVMYQIFVGLTRQDEETGEIEPGLITEWSAEEVDGGSVYTFNLLEGVPWVRVNPDSGEVEEVTDADGNVRYVTANDFVYGITRSLDPATASPYSYIILGHITGADTFNAGESDASSLGVAAVDDYTLQITSPVAPVPWAPSIYGLWMAYAEPQWAIEEFGDSWTEAENINTYGPFALAEWAHDESITLVKNPFWPGTDTTPQATVDSVVFRFLDPQTQFTEFLAGTMDAAEVPLEEIVRVQNDPELSPMYSVGTNPCTYYIGFDNVEAPTDNVNLRRALSLAIDRQSIVENVTRGGQLPAQWFTRPGLNAAPTMETHPDLGITFDPEAAQEALAAALSDLGLSSVDELPPLTLSYNDSSGHGAIMQAIQQMWSDNLGISNVQLVPLDPSTYFASLSEEAPMIYRSGWCQDYGDANNFAFDVFHSSSSQNDTGFSNEAFDELVVAAQQTTDVEERRELYAQAEEILVDEQAAIIPVYWYTENQITQPYVERTYSVVGQERYEKWDINR
jgi:oligopeptide transport system substrate-binding protein